MTSGTDLPKEDWRATGTTRKEFTMSRTKRFGLVAGLFGAGLLLAGCQAAGNRPAHTTAGATTQALKCDKCKVTYAQVPIDAGKGRIVGYRSQKNMECPDCKSAAANFFATGKFEHNCKTCGPSMEVCEAH
jgi:hypothetical protein